MKSFVVLVLVLCFAWSQGENETVGCSILNGNLVLKPNEAFEIGDACLRIICRGNDVFNIATGCEIRWRGAPSDFYKKQITQLAENVRKGYACSGVDVPTFTK
nr:uncharacterized protein LOC111422637 isoform X1 [Onthophagus taurus]